jgi:hypothetical protein
VAPCRDHREHWASRAAGAVTNGMEGAAARPLRPSQIRKATDIGRKAGQTPADNEAVRASINGPGNRVSVALSLNGSDRVCRVVPNREGTGPSADGAIGADNNALFVIGTLRSLALERF